MRTFVLLALVAVPALAFLSVEEDAKRFAFNDWKVAHSRTYASVEEEALRFAIFSANMDRVNAHNAKGLSWTLAMNEFGDLTPTEFSIGRIGGYVPRKLRRSNKNAEKHVLSGKAAPASIDWTTKGAVTPVKNQGQCGSCWAFSTTGSTEGSHFIKDGKLISLSEQQLVDCAGSTGNQGCNGGLMDDAFQYIINNKGICTEASYPYTAQDGTCHKCTAAVTITSYKDVTPNSPVALEDAVAQQPVSVAIEADQSSFQLYSGGIISANCGSQLDHGVLVVGYGADGGKDYWKVKNSWGGSWGEAGYVRLARSTSGTSPYDGGAGMCGILSDPSYPVS